jgi:hypothetical protein
MMTNPYSEYRRAYGGGKDDRVERRGGMAAPPYVLEVR